MIKVILRKGLLCSHFYCDVCGEEIERVSEALLAIPECFNFEKMRSGIIAQHVHKGRCQRKLELQSRAITYGDLELRDHIASLLVNVRWKKEDWERAMDGYMNMFTSQVDGDEGG